MNDINLKKKLIFKDNILVTTFLLLQILFVVPALVVCFTIRGVHTFEAVIWHILLTVLFFCGYQFTKFYFKGEDIKSKKNVIFGTNKFFNVLIIGLSLFGVLVSAVTVDNISNLSGYFKLLFFENNSQLLSQVKYEVSTGGLPGYLKMFGYAPIAVFMTICSYLFFCSFNDAKTKKKFIVIAVIAGFCSLGKVIFTLDRLPILSVFIVLFFYSIRIRKSNFKIIALVVVFFIVSFFLLKFVTSTKMNNMSILDFLSLYSGLGIVNFQLLLNNFSEWSYGLNSFFHPFYFIGKAFNYNIHIPAAQDSFWGGPQYFYSYLYMDFGYYIFLIVPLLGGILYYYHNKVLNHNPIAISIYFIMLFCISTTIVIPIFRAVEFWLMIIISIMIYKMISFSNYKTFL